MEVTRLTCDLNIKVYNRGDRWAGLLPGILVYGADIDDVVERARKAMRLILNGFDTIDDMVRCLEHKGIDCSVQQQDTSEFQFQYDFFTDESARAEKEAL